MKTHYSQLRINTEKNVNFIDISDQIRVLIRESGVKEGIVSVTGLHTTTAVTVNENEQRLLEDINVFLERMAPKGDKYLHNDIHLRDCPPDEPENAHAHLIAMMFGNSECFSLRQGALSLGQWQSVFLVELDGPRERRVDIQILGCD